MSNQRARFVPHDHGISPWGKAFDVEYIPCYCTAENSTLNTPSVPNMATEVL